jgi:hypothetical protein
LEVRNDAFLKFFNFRENIPEPSFSFLDFPFRPQFLIWPC